MSCTLRLIIPAAGAGIRFGGSENVVPKLLIPISGRPLISHVLRMASAADLFSQIVFILGPHFEAVVQTLKDLVSNVKWLSATEIMCIKNPAFEKTNNVFSLYLARRYLEGDIVVHNSDVLIAPLLLKRLVSETLRDMGWVLADRVMPIPDEETKVITDASDRVIEIGEEIPSNKGHGRYVGVCRFGSGASEIFREAIGSLVEKGDLAAFYTKAIQGVAGRCSVKSVWTDGSTWLEIDTLRDLMSAGTKSRDITQQISTRQMGHLATVRIL
jgi:choline kinase